jgi:NAD(P)-dependent dehydrogenase (short-subunit alcohol dehydrogenase family)
MAVSLAEKLGKKGLLVFSVHPGVIMGTNLISHLDIQNELDGMGTFPHTLWYGSKGLVLTILQPRWTR